MNKVKCLNCGAMIEIDFEPVRGDFIVCDECESEFEIVSTKPIKVDWIDYGDDEGFDYDDDNDY